MRTAPLHQQSGEDVSTRIEPTNTTTSGSNKQFLSIQASKNEKKDENLENEESFVMQTNKSIMDDDDDDDAEERDPREDDYSVAGEEEFNTEWETLPSAPINCSACHIEDLQFVVACENQLAEQIELMTKCRHPMDLFAAPWKYQAEDLNEQTAGAVAGFHYIPNTCEYCGACSLSECVDKCQRPKSFFYKKRPPFCRPSSKWNAVTDDEIVLKTSTEDGEEQDKQQTKGTESTFRAFSGFFQG